MLLALSFFLTAVVFSAVGHAGASGYLAAMGLLGTAPATMRPTALVLNVLVASLGTIRYARAGHFSWRLFLPFALTSVPLSFVGGAIALPGPVYRQLVGVVLALAALRLAATAGRGSAEECAEAAPPVGPALAWGAAIGFVAGLTGTGGGIFLSPVLLFLGWSNVRMASGVSAPFVLVNSISGILAAPDAIRMLPPEFPLWAVAVLLGGWIGSGLGARRLAPAGMRVVLAAVLLVAAGKLVFAS